MHVKESNMRIIVDNVLYQRCSFCNRVKDEVPRKQFIGGADRKVTVNGVSIVKETLICDDCITQATEIIK